MGRPEGGDNGLITTSPFILDANGFHAGTKRHYEFGVAELVKEATSRGDQYRRMFLGLPPVENKPSRKLLLRSLTQAKQCRHLGPELSRDPECGACTRHQCAKRGETKLPYCMQECQQWEIATKLQQIANFPKIAIAPIKFDQTNLAPETGGQRLNPSIIESRDGYIFAYRNRWGNSDVSLIRLSKDFVPVGKPKQLNLSHPVAKSGREDPRLFRHKGKLHIWYTGWNGWSKSRKKNAANVLFARINEDTFEVEDKFFPVLPVRNNWEKNHSYFDCQHETYAVYSTIPTHKILKVHGNTLQHIYETNNPFTWSHGYARGGASPVLHNGEYYHFFHGADDSRGRRVYSIGVATFDPVPPFRIKRMTTEPLEIASRNHGGKLDVIFPGGAMFVNGQWVIACGVHDTHSEIRFYSAALVESMLS